MLIKPNKQLLRTQCPQSGPRREGEAPETAWSSPHSLIFLQLFTRGEFPSWRRREAPSHQPRPRAPPTPPTPGPSAAHLFCEASIYKAGHDLRSTLPSKNRKSLRSRQAPAPACRAASWGSAVPSSSPLLLLQPLLAQHRPQLQVTGHLAAHAPRHLHLGPGSAPEPSPGRTWFPFDSFDNPPEASVLVHSSTEGPEALGGRGLSPDQEASGWQSWEEWQVSLRGFVHHARGSTSRPQGPFSLGRAPWALTP